MAIIKGNNVKNATRYELYEVVNNGYTFTVLDCGYGGSDTIVKINGVPQSNAIGTWEDVKTVEISSRYGDVLYFMYVQGPFPYDTYSTRGGYTLTGDVTIGNIDK